MGKYAEICKGVIKIYSNIAQDLGTKLNEESWQILLGIIVGITDYFIKIKPDMHDEFSPVLIEKVFMFYIQSGVENIEFISELLITWGHNYYFMDYWFNTTREVTKSVVHLLYGKYQKYAILDNSDLNSEVYEGKCLNIIKLDKKKAILMQSFKIPNDQLICLWYNLVTIFERSNIGEIYLKKLKDKKAYLRYSDYFFQILQILINYDCDKNKMLILNPMYKYDIQEIIPKSLRRDSLSEKIDSLLKTKYPHIIYGQTLIDYLGIKIFCNHYFERCKFLINFSPPYRNEYLYLLYNELDHILMNKGKYDDDLNQEIVTNTLEFFLTNIYGINIFIPKFLKLFSILIKSQKTIPGFFETMIKQLSNISSIISGFAVSEHLTTKYKLLSDTSMKIKEYIKTINDLYEDILKRSSNMTNILCLYYWCKYINMIQEESPTERINALCELLGEAFKQRILGDQSNENTTVLFTIADISEMLIDSIKFDETIDQKCIANLETIVSTLFNITEINIAYEKFRLKERIPLYYEPITLATLRICKMICQLNGFSSKNVILKVKSLSEKVKKGITYKKILEHINYVKIWKILRMILDSILNGNEKEHNNIYFHNTESVIFLNETPLNKAQNDSIGSNSINLFVRNKLITIDRKSVV